MVTAMHWDDPLETVWASQARCSRSLWPIKDHVQPIRPLVRMGIFAKIFQGLAQPGAQGNTVMMDSTFLKMHLTATGLRES
jgi:hypothetical protein